MEIDICFESAFLGNLVEKKKMSARLSVEERVQFVWLYAKFESIVKVQRKWRNLFTSEPPSSPTILSLVEKFKETGSVHDRDRSDRPRSVVTE